MNKQKLVSIAFIIAALFLWWLVGQYNNNEVESLQSYYHDTETMYILCVIAKTNIASARITENSMNLESEYYDLSEVERDKKNAFISEALVSASENITWYNRIAKKYSKERMIKANLPEKITEDISTSTKLNCTNRSE